jgi:LmbE family N-acetylglucosaminyl deacetylase
MDRVWPNTAARNDAGTPSVPAKFMIAPRTRDKAQTDLLAALLDPARGRFRAPEVGIVVSHPDDETIGCGSRLAHWEGATLVMVTDGAPANLTDARAQGFATAAAYAAARRRELNEALAASGAESLVLLTLEVPDQQVARRLMEVTSRLFEIAQDREWRIVLTHAYEGGHPDHDATAFAAHAACALLSAKGTRTLVAEMPYYRSDASGFIVRQYFTPHPELPVTELRLTGAEQDLKRRMMAAYRTQKNVLAQFAIDIERFRPSPLYDFTVLPNGGHLLYEQFDWGLSGHEWRVLARKALAGLGLARPQR